MDRTKILAVLALPVGAVLYVVTASLLSGLALPSGLKGLVMLVVPLFVAGVGMALSLLPTFDRMAKRDLAAHRAAQGVDHGAEPVRDGVKDRSPDA